MQGPFRWHGQLSDFPTVARAIETHKPHYLSFMVALDPSSWLFLGGPIYNPMILEIVVAPTHKPCNSYGAVLRVCLNLAIVEDD